MFITFLKKIKVINEIKIKKIKVEIFKKWLLDMYIFNNTIIT